MESGFARGGGEEKESERGKGVRNKNDARTWYDSVTVLRFYFPIKKKLQRVFILV